MYLSQKEINEAFVNTHLEENYNFLASDLVLLANAFVKAAKPKIAAEERGECIKVAKALTPITTNTSRFLPHYFE